MQDLPSRKERRFLPIIRLGVVITGATSLFLFAHELGHAAGFWLSGFKPCIGINNCWAAAPHEGTKTLLAGLLGPLTSLLLGLGFLVAHFTFRSGKKWTFAFGLTNFLAHPVFPLAFVFNLLLSGRVIGGFAEEAELALMLPATQSTTDALQQLSSGIDRFFLLRWQSLLVLWPLTLVPMLGVVLLLWKGRLSGPNRDIPFIIAAAVAAIAAGQVNYNLAKLGWHVCFGS